MQEGLRVLHHGIVQIHVQGRTKEDEGNKTIRKIKYCLYPWVALAQNKGCWRRGETEEKRVRRLSSDGSGHHGDGADGVRSTKHVYTLWRSSHLKKKKKTEKNAGRRGSPMGWAQTRRYSWVSEPASSKYFCDCLTHFEAENKKSKWPVYHKKVV